MYTNNFGNYLTPNLKLTIHQKPIIKNDLQNFYTSMFMGEIKLTVWHLKYILLKGLKYNDNRIKSNFVFPKHTNNATAEELLKKTYEQ